ncbi:hypothetical protein NOGI109294_05770 [Nocardiopsis gilva]
MHPRTLEEGGGLGSHSPGTASHGETAWFFFASRRPRVAKYDEGMSEAKKRVTLTLDPELLEAAEAAVDAGEVRSVSAWVNTALGEKKRRQERAQMLIEQDLVQARESDPEEYERAMQWAQRVLGVAADEVA